MQDLTPVQHALVARLFRCGRTVLGDCCQVVDDGNSATLLEDVARAYGAARVVRLTRSYRSTSEIVALANRVKPAAGLEAVERHGEEPRIVGCADTAEVLARTLEAVRAFRASGRKTLGILHASDELAARYAELLSRDVDVHLLTERTRDLRGGRVGGVRQDGEGPRVRRGGRARRRRALLLHRARTHPPLRRGYPAPLHRLTVLHRGRPSRFLAG